MSTVVLQEPPQTVAELVERLDDVPLDRIRLVPPPGTATEADLVELAERADKVLCELVEGTLVEKTVGQYESALAMYLGRLLLNFIDEHDIAGYVTGPDGGYRMSTGGVRLPDVSFTTGERMPDDDTRRDPVAGWVPDLGIEILSPSNRPGENDRKVREYFESGMRLVWYVDPPTRTVRVFTSPTHVVSHGENDTLDGGDLLPGFELSVRDLFESV